MVTMTFQQETWHSYVARLKATYGAPAVAKAAGVAQSSVYRWIDPNDESEPSFQNVASLGRNLGESAIEALIAARYLEPSDVGNVVEVYQDIDTLSDNEFVTELARRLRSRRAQDDDISRRLSDFDDLG